MLHCSLHHFQVGPVRCYTGGPWANRTLPHVLGFKHVSKSSWVLDALLSWTGAKVLHPLPAPEVSIQQASPGNTEYSPTCQYANTCTNLYHLVVLHWHEWISSGDSVSSSFSFMPTCHDLDPSPLFHSEDRHSKWAAWRIPTPGNSINPVAVAYWLFHDPHCVLWLAFSLVCFSFQPSTKSLIQLEQLLSSNWKRCQSDLENTVQIPWNKANHRNGLLAFKLQNPRITERSTCHPCESSQPSSATSLWEPKFLPYTEAFGYAHHPACHTIIYSVHFPSLCSLLLYP